MTTNMFPKLLKYYGTKQPNQFRSVFQRANRIQIYVQLGETADNISRVSTNFANMYLTEMTGAAY